MVHSVPVRNKKTSSIIFVVSSSVRGRNTAATYDVDGIYML